MLCKVTHCAECVSANTRPHQVVKHYYCKNWEASSHAVSSCKVTVHKLLLSEILHPLCNLQTHADQPLCCVRHLHKHKLVHMRKCYYNEVC